MMSQGAVVVGAGSIGSTTARRIAAGKHVPLAVTTATVDVPRRASVEAVLTATGLSEVAGLIHAAGVAPSQAPLAMIPGCRCLRHGTGARNVRRHHRQRRRCRDRLAVRHRLPGPPAEQNAQLATTPVDALLAPILQPDRVTDSSAAYQLSKRGKLRVQSEAVRWAKRGTRVNTISPASSSHLANDELSGPHRPSTRRMMDLCLVGRAGTPDEIGTVAALLMGGGGLITGSDVLLNGGVTASYVYGPRPRSLTALSTFEKDVCCLNTTTWPVGAAWNGFQQAEVTGGGAGAETPLKRFGMHGVTPAIMPASNEARTVAGEVDIHRRRSAAAPAPPQQIGLQGPPAVRAKHAFPCVRSTPLRACKARLRVTAGRRRRPRLLCRQRSLARSLADQPRLARSGSKGRGSSCEARHRSRTKQAIACRRSKLSRDGKSRAAPSPFSPSCDQ